MTPGTSHHGASRGLGARAAAVALGLLLLAALLGAVSAAPTAVAAGTAINCRTGTNGTNWLINQQSTVIGTSSSYTNRLQYYDTAATGTATATTLIKDLSSVVTKQTNALGIAAGGRYFYFTDFDISPTGNPAPKVYRYDIVNDAVTSWPAAYDSPASSGTNNYAVRRGAVNLATGIYYYSTSSTVATSTVNYLYALDPATGTSWYVGTVNTANAGQSGDMTFDTRGNLYFGVGANGNMYLNAYSGALPTSPNSTPITIAPTFVNAFSSGTSSNGAGLAYGPDGYLYVSYTSGAVYKVDPATGNQLGTLASFGTTSGATVDLSTCSSPSTFTLRKNVAGRAVAGDQFALSADFVTGSTTTVLGSTATTTGSADGVQAAQVGPAPILVGNPSNSYRIHETISGSSTFANYLTAYSCVDHNDATWSLSGTIATTGGARDATLGSISAPTSADTRDIVCTLTNTSVRVPVTVSKVVQDAQGLSPTAGSGWTLGSAATATTGSLTASPAATTQTTGASGTVSWNLQLSAVTARATVAVSETQQSNYQFVSGKCVVTHRGSSAAADTVTFAGAGGGNVTGVAPGDQVDCTFTNKVRPSTLTLIKKIDYGTAVASAWTLTATAPAGSLAGPSGATGVNGQVTAGSTYTLAENEPTGLGAYVQKGAWACVDGTGAAVAVTDSKVTMPGAPTSVTCTVTNTTASMTLLKRVTGGRSLASDWTLKADPGTNTKGLTAKQATGATGESTSNTWDVRPGQAYALTETAAAGSTLAYLLDRVEVSTDGGTTWTTVANPASVTVAAGTHATFRFVNKPAPTFALPLTGGSAADWYRYGGGLVVALAAAVAVEHRRRTVRPQISNEPPHHRGKRRKP